MGYAAQVRIELDDRPGALAAVAGVIAAVGGNIDAVDVHAVDGLRVVDEMTLGLPDGVGSEQLRTALADQAAASLLSHQMARAVTDPVVQILDSFGSLMLAEPARRDALVVEALRDICVTPFVLMVATPQALEFESARLAYERGASVALRSAHIPNEGDTLAPAEGWVLAVGDAPHGPRSFALIARALSLPFTATEVRRAEALLSARHILESVLGRQTTLVC